MALVTTISLLGLSAGAGLCLLRLIQAESIADRLIALDTLLVISVIGIAVVAVRTATEAYTPVLLVTSLLAFVGTVTVARYIERRAR